MSKVLAWIAAVMSGALAFVVAVDPVNYFARRTDFFIFAIYQFRVELMILSISGICIAVAYASGAGRRLFAIINDVLLWSKDSTLSERLARLVMVQIPVGLVLLSSIPAIMEEVTLALRARLVYVTDIMPKEYRYELLLRAIDAEQAGEISEAGAFYERVRREFPHDPLNGWIERRLLMGRHAAEDAAGLFESFEQSEARLGMNPAGLDFLIGAVRLRPDHGGYRAALLTRITVLREATARAGAIAASCDSTGLDGGEQEYYLDPGLRVLIRNRSKKPLPDDRTVICGLYGHPDEAKLERILRTLWRMDAAETAIARFSPAGVEARIAKLELERGDVERYRLEQYDPQVAALKAVAERWLERVGLSRTTQQ